jgi:hypothetical protein
LKSGREANRIRRLVDFPEVTPDRGKAHGRWLRSLDNLRVASPCTVRWGSMSGNDQVRHCDECNLNVYDISKMTRREAEAFIATTEGRIGGRIYRRADGTVLTRDCPVGRRALRRRASRVAGAAFAAVISLCTAAIGQRSSKSEARCDSRTKSEGHVGSDSQLSITRTKTGQEGETKSVVSGSVVDPKEVVIPRCVVTIVNERTKEPVVTRTNEKGHFHFEALEPGSYTLIVEYPGFRKFLNEHIEVTSSEALLIKAALRVGAPDFMVGLLSEDPAPIGNSRTIDTSAEGILRVHN